MAICLVLYYCRYRGTGVYMAHYSTSASSTVVVSLQYTGERQYGSFMYSACSIANIPNVVRLGRYIGYSVIVLLWYSKGDPTIGDP